MDSYPDVHLNTGLVAENHARESGISRDEQDAFALRIIGAPLLPSTASARPEEASARRASSSAD